MPSSSQTTLLAESVDRIVLPHFAADASLKKCGWRVFSFFFCSKQLYSDCTFRSKFFHFIYICMHYQVHFRKNPINDGKKCQCLNYERKWRTFLCAGFFYYVLCYRALAELPSFEAKFFVGT